MTDLSQAQTVQFILPFNLQERGGDSVLRPA
jgi:hypothetical protein